MKSLYAVLVGIEAYPNNVTSLKGCVDDTLDIDLLLQEIAGTIHKIPYKPLFLHDKNAKRQQVIDAFQHFDQAADGDLCVFYFSGHGSRVASKEYYWANGSTTLESLVCFDSRYEFGEGYDLVDKELAYLLWKATHQKPNLHFVTIMDCCYAGDNTKDFKLDILKMEKENEHIRAVEQFEGYHAWVNGQPPTGAHYISLSASRPDETAKISQFEGVYRSVFTYFLTQTIRHADMPLTYEQLMEIVKVKVAQSTRLQTPYPEPFNFDSNSYFLSLHTTLSGITVPGHF
jgi:hypothetical protein